MPCTSDLFRYFFFCWSQVRLVSKVGYLVHFSVAERDLGLSWWSLASHFAPLHAQLTHPCGKWHVLVFLENLRLGEVITGVFPMHVVHMPMLGIMYMCFPFAVISPSLRGKKTAQVKMTQRKCTRLTGHLEADFFFFHDNLKRDGQAGWDKETRW